MSNVVLRLSVLFLLAFSFRSYAQQLPNPGRFEGDIARFEVQDGARMTVETLVLKGVLALNGGLVSIGIVDGSISNKGSTLTLPRSQGGMYIKDNKQIFIYR